MIFGSTSKMKKARENVSEPSKKLKNVEESKENNQIP